MRASSSTHGIYQPTMIPALMCSPTQLKTIPHSSADISMHEGSHCVYADATMWAGPLQHSCVASLILCGWVCSKKRTRVDSSSQPPSDSCPGGLVQSIRKTAAASFQQAPLAQKAWQVTMKHKGHRHMDPIQRATLGLKSQQRGKKWFPWKTLEGMEAEEL